MSAIALGIVLFLLAGYLVMNLERLIYRQRPICEVVPAFLDRAKRLGLSRDAPAARTSHERRHWREWAEPEDSSRYEHFLERLKQHHRFIADWIGTRHPGVVTSEAIAIARERWEILAPISVEMFTLITSPTIDSAMNQHGRMYAFCARVLAPSANTDAQTTALVHSRLEEVFVAGFLVHHALTSFPGRETSVERIDISALVSRFPGEALGADSRLRSYDLKHARIASTIAVALYEDRLEHLLRDVIRIGWWKRAKSLSFFTNLFWAGILLGVMTDLSGRTGDRGH